MRGFLAGELHCDEAAEQIGQNYLGMAEAYAAGDVKRSEGRVALVTGGGTGISGRRPEPLAETVEAIEAADGRALAVAGDVAVEADAERMVAETTAAFGRLDVLVNKAGAIRRNVLLHELPAERWDELVAVNLRSVFLVTRAALRHMLELKGDRSIVNISLTFALAAGPGVSACTAAKGGVFSLTRALAIEYASHGIRVNCVCPAIVVTPLAHVDRRSSTSRRRSSPDVPARPAGRAGGCRRRDRLLRLNRRRWVTGTVLEVDGGFTAK